MRPIKKMRWVIKKLILLVSIIIVLVSLRWESPLNEEEHPAPVFNLTAASLTDEYFYGDSIILTISSTSKTGINVIYFVESKTTIFVKVPGEKVESFDTTFSIPITKSYPYGPSKFSINVVDNDNSQTVKAYKFKVRKPKKQSSLAPVLSLSAKSLINKYYYGDSITLSISSATKTGINVIYFLESRKTVFVKIPGETVESFDTTFNLPITPSYPNGLSEFSVSMIDDDNTQTIETYEFEVLQNNVSEKEAQSLPLLSLGTISSTDKYFHGDSITFLISANAKAGINNINYISKSTSPLYEKLTQ